MATASSRVGVVVGAVAFVVGLLVTVAAAQPTMPSASSSPPTATELLSGVSCPSARMCVAVGDKSDLIGPGDETTLIERWDGVRWSIMASPSPGTFNSILESVSCLSATNCVAVGYFSAVFGQEQTLVERWDGAAWSVVPSPNAVGHASFLRGVSCPRVGERELDPSVPQGSGDVPDHVGAPECVAVGDSEAPPNGDDQTLVETWNGTTWSITPSPAPGPSSSSLLGVACTSADRCTAAGWDFGSPASSQGLIETWNGSQWSVTPSPSPGIDGVLNAVACSRPRRCMAVGFYLDGVRSVTFGERWNGISWSVTPTVSRGRDNLAGVSCANSERCVAVGLSYNGSVDQTLTEIWNGRTWAFTPSPSPGTNALLQSVFCSGPRRCMAVGQTFQASNTSSALAEIWNGKQWSTSMTAP